MCWTEQGRDSHSPAQGNPGLLPSAGPVSCQKLLVFLQKSQAWPIWTSCQLPGQPFQSLLLTVVRVVLPRPTSEQSLLGLNLPWLRTSSSSSGIHSLSLLVSQGFCISSQSHTFPPIPSSLSSPSAHLGMKDVCSALM